MLGSVPQAETGEIGFVVGGDPAALERITPLLEHLGRFTKYAGPAGSANRIKMIHQTLVAANAVAVAEAIALCQETDTDLDCFYDVVCNAGGFAYSRYFEKRVPRMREDDFSPLFMLDLMTKDAKLAQSLAADRRDGGAAARARDRAFRSGPAGGAGQRRLLRRRAALPREFRRLNSASLSGCVASVKCDPPAWRNCHNRLLGIACRRLYLGSANLRFSLRRSLPYGSR